MNGYTCTKACNIGGVVYSKGDAVPFEAVLPSRERALIAQGYIARSSADAQVAGTPKEMGHLRSRIAKLEEAVKEAAAVSEENETLRTRIAELEEAAVPTAGTTPEGAKEPLKIVVPITTKDGILELQMAPEDIVAAITAMQLNAENAAAAVGAIEKEDTLILIDAVDKRKTVHTAILERVEAIKNSEEESKEKSGENTEGGSKGDGKEDESQGDA